MQTTIGPTAPAYVAVHRATESGTLPIGRPSGYLTEARKAAAAAALLRAPADGTMAHQIADYRLEGASSPAALVQAAETLCSIANEYRKARWAGQDVPRLGESFFPYCKAAPGDTTGQLWQRSLTPLARLCEAHRAACCTGMNPACESLAVECLVTLQDTTTLYAAYPGIPPSIESAAAKQGYSVAEFLVDLAAATALQLVGLFNEVTGPRADEFKRAARLASLHATSARTVMAQGVEYTLQGKGLAVGPAK